MLFQSMVPNLLKSIAIDFNDQAAQARKREHAKRLDFFYGQQLAHLEVTLSGLFADPSRLQKLTLNVVHKIICNLCGLYRIAPTREVVGSGSDQKIYKGIVESGQIDIRLKQATRLTKLLKSLLIRVAWRGDAIAFDFVTGNVLDVVTGETPDDLQTVLITDYGDSNKIEDIEYSLWTAAEFRRLDFQGATIHREENPYHQLPFLPVFDSLPINADFWQPGGEDLVLAQEAINTKLTDLLHILHHQSFGVGYIKNQVGDPLSEDSPLLYGPGSLIELQGKESEVGFTSQKANIQAILNSIDKLIRWVCVSHGLSASTMATDASVESGISKIWGSTELSERRAEDKALWRSYENQLFDLTKIVHNTHSSKNLSDGCELKINFSDPSARPSTSLLDEAEADWMRYRMGTLSPVDVLMRSDSDLTSREAAIERLQQIKKEREMFSVPEDVSQSLPVSTRPTGR